MSVQDTDANKEENNFLAAYHMLKFSKTDKDEMEKVDIERRCIATKYFTARRFISEDVASHLLDKGLEDYSALMENKDGVNNYWKQIKMQVPKVSNDPQLWKTGLKDVDTALNFVKALPCQENNTMPCKGRILTDRHIESIANVWKNKETLTRNRKVSAGPRTHGNQRSNCNSQTRSVCHTTNGTNYELENVSGHANYIKNQVPKSYPISHQNQNIPRLRTLKPEPVVQCNVTRSSSFNTVHYNLEQPNVYRNNVRSKSQESVQSNEDDLDESKPKMNSFKTARQELSIQQMKKANKQGQQKSLGGKVTVNSKFVCPLKREQEKAMQGQANGCNSEPNSMEIEDERLKNIDPKMVELIRNEIMDSKTTISWDDIAGLEYAKKIIKEVVVYPMLRPDIFTGLRRPPKGILLFGPPGTGKTLIGKCIASQSKSTFFSISASSLTSKWIGEGEKMVRALFAVARVFQPSVIFVDEIDSLLTQRSETEHESSRRLKTEFLVQLDGAATAEEDRILIVGATNRPQELDEAARRRLVKRLYVPLPELQARKQIINNLLITVPHNLTEQDITDMAEQSKGYSGADMSNLCKEASMGPIRSISFSQLENIKKEDVRHVTVDDFKEALIHVRPSVSESSLSAYVEWDSTYGTGTAQNYKAL